MLLVTRFNRTALQNILKIKRMQGKDETKGSIRTIYDFLISSCSDTNGTVFVRHKTIAKRTGFSDSTIKRGIKKLQELGLILVQNRKEEYCDNNKSNLYYICEMFDKKILKVLKAFVKKFKLVRDTKNFEEIRELELVKISEEVKKEEENNARLKINENVEYETFDFKKYRQQQEEKRNKNVELFRSILKNEETLRLKDQAKTLGIKARGFGIDLKRSQIDTLIETYTFEEIYEALEITAEHNVSKAKYVKKVLYDKFKKNKKQLNFT